MPAVIGVVDTPPRRLIRRCRAAAIYYAIATALRRRLPFSLAAFSRYSLILLRRRFHYAAATRRYLLPLSLDAIAADAAILLLPPSTPPLFAPPPPARGAPAIAIFRHDAVILFAALRYYYFALIFAAFDAPRSSHFRARAQAPYFSASLMPFSMPDMLRVSASRRHLFEAALYHDSLCHAAHGAALPTPPLFIPHFRAGRYASRRHRQSSRHAMMMLLIAQPPSPHAMPASSRAAMMLADAAIPPAPPAAHFFTFHAIHAAMMPLSPSMLSFADFASVMPPSCACFGR